MEFALAFAAQATAILIWTFVNASLLQWRARKLRQWAIGYKQAWVVALKAGFAGLLFAYAAAFAVGFTGSANEALYENVARLFGLVAWWFMHSSSLLKLADSSAMLTVKDARRISASVFGYGFGGVLLVGLIVVLAMLALPAVEARGGHSNGGHASHGGTYSHGTKRSHAARAAFQRSNPCPSTGNTSGACPGYVVDHVVPLKRGGADAPSNMQWQTVQQAKEKDKWE